MPSRSPLRRFSPALVVLGLALGACTSRPCPEERDLGNVSSGEIDYVFGDGTTLSANLAQIGSTSGASFSAGVLNLDWHAPAAAVKGTEGALELSFEPPATDGSFDLGDVKARVCACQSGSVSSNTVAPQCMLDFKTATMPADCRAVAGQLELHTLVDGKCDGRDGCVRTTVIEVILDEDAKKGISGSVGILLGTRHEQASCVSSPFFG
ncbi:MAG: hypothetical protein ABJE95_02380 [Byssovorax sp.]